MNVDAVTFNFICRRTAQALWEESWRTGTASGRAPLLIRSRDYLSYCVLVLTIHFPVPHLTRVCFYRFWNGHVSKSWQMQKFALALRIRRYRHMRTSPVIARNCMGVWGTALSCSLGIGSIVRRNGLDRDVNRRAKQNPVLWPMLRSSGSRTGFWAWAESIGYHLRSSGNQRLHEQETTLVIGVEFEYYASCLVPFLSLKVVWLRSENVIFTHFLLMPNTRSCLKLVALFRWFALSLNGTPVSHLTSPPFQALKSRSTRLKLSLCCFKI